MKGESAEGDQREDRNYINGEHSVSCPSEINTKLEEFAKSKSNCSEPEITIMFVTNLGEKLDSEDIYDVTK